jgi:iron complex transport system substrate-binding protein
MKKMCFVLLLGVVFWGGCRQDANKPVDKSGPVRIVSLAPSLTEAVCAVGAGDLLVGITSSCNYPEGVVSNVAVVGGFGTPSLELLVKVRPTLVLESGLADKSLAAKIDALGVRRVRIDCKSFAQISDMLRRVGELSGHAEAGKRVADEFDVRLAKLRKSSSRSEPVSVYAEVWGDPLTTTGRGTVLSELIEAAGGKNIGDAVGRDYFQIAPESVLSSNPEVILCFYGGAGAAGSVVGRLGWKNVRAVKNGAVYDNLDNDILLRPGPRVLDGVEMLRGYIEKAARHEE